MKKALIVKLLLIPFIFIASSCASRSFKNDFTFANSLASKGLWKEAGYRWKKSIENGNKSSAVHNNLAIAYEFLGKLDLAMKEYKVALKLDPGNQMVEKNIEKLKIRMGFLKKPVPDKKRKKKRGKK